MLTANYFKLQKQPEFSLNQYRVDFEPDTDITQVRKTIMSRCKDQLGCRYVFDGASIYMSKFFDERTLETEFNGKIIHVNIRRTGEVKHTDPTAFQLFNLIFREAMGGLKLQNIRRDYFDPAAKVIQHNLPCDCFYNLFFHLQIDIPKGKLELWPGYITSIRAHENDVLMNAEINRKLK